MARGAEAKVRVRITDGGDLKKLEKGSRSADRALKGTARTSSSSTKNFSKMSQGITGGLVPAYATLAANLFAITAVFGALKEAADLRVMREGMIAYGQATGTAMTTVATSLQRVTAAQLDYGAAMKATATLTAAGFDSSMIMQMGEAAKNASAALGHNFEDAFNRITKGIQKAEPELLDELGIVLRLDEATRKYAEQVGKTQKDLTLYERTIAVHNEVIGQATAKYGQLESNLKVSGINQMATAFGNVKQAALEGLAPIAEMFASVFTKNIGLVIAAMGLFAVSMLKAAGIGDGLKSKTELWAENAKAGAINARAAVARYNDELARSKMSMDEIKGQAQGKLRGIVAPKTGGGKGAEMLRKGQFDELSKNKKILRSWKNTAKEHLLITKNMTDAEYQDFMQMVDDLLLEEKSFVQESKSIGGKWLTQWKEYFAQMNIGVQKVKGWLVKGFAGIGKAMGKMMSIIGWASILTMLFKTIQTTWRNLDRTVKAFGDWADSISKMFGNKGLTKLEQLFKKISGNVLEGTKEWRKHKEELREILETGDKMKAGSKELTDSYAEFRDITKGLAYEFKGMAATAELFIKTMKLLESAAIVGSFQTWQIQINSLIGPLGDLKAKQTALGAKPEKQGGMIERRGQEWFQESAESTEARSTWQTESNRLNSRINAAMSSLDVQGIKTALTDANKMANYVRALFEGREGANVDFSWDPAAIITQIEALEKERDTGDLSAEAFAERLLEVIAGGEKSYKDAADNIIKPGKALTELTDLLASYNKEMANMKTKNYPKEWAKLGSFIGLAENNLQNLVDSNQGSLQLSKEEVEVLRGMGVVLEDNVIVSKALEAIDKRRVDLLEMAWGYEERILEVKNLAIERQNVGTKLGGALGKELKHKEKIAKIDDNITSNAILQEELEAQKGEGIYKDEELYQSKMANLQNIEKQLKKNREIEEESMTLQFKLVNSFQMAFENLFTEIAKGEKKIGDIFKDVTRMMLQQIAQMMAQMAAIAAMKAIFGPTMFGIPIGGREGGVFSPPGYRSFAGGGIATGSNSGYLATLHGTEAVVPLGNDKSIPVKFSGDSTSTSNITVNVSASGGQTTTSAGAGEKERKLGQMVAAAVQAEILEQQRPGNILSPYGDGDY